MHLSYLWQNARNDPPARVSSVNWCHCHILKFLLSVSRHWASPTTLKSALIFVHLIACIWPMCWKMLGMILKLECHALLGVVLVISIFFFACRHWASLITLISVLIFVHLVACAYILQIFCLQTLSIPDHTENCGSYVCTWLHAFKLSVAKCSAGSSSQSFSCKLVRCARSPIFFL